VKDTFGYSSPQKATSERDIRVEFTGKNLTKFGGNQKEGIMSYSLDVNISHFYGANVAHFHLVMLAYNLMNLFKELVLGQKEKKRMGKWIRQKIFLIAGKLGRNGRRFILKLSEDWAYQEEYNESERRLGSMVWVT